MAVLVAPWCRPHLHPAVVARCRAHLHLVVDALAAQQWFPLGCCQLPVVGVDEALRGTTDQVVRCPAQDGRDRRGHPGHHAPEVEQHGDVRDVLGKQPVPLLALGQGLGDPLLAALELLLRVVRGLDVPEPDDSADDAPAVVEHRLRPHLHPAVISCGGAHRGFELCGLTAHDLRLHGTEPVRSLRPHGVDAAMTDEVLRRPAQGRRDRRRHPGDRAVGLANHDDVRDVLGEQPVALLALLECPVGPLLTLQELHLRRDVVEHPHSTLLGGGVDGHAGDAQVGRGAVQVPHPVVRDRRRRLPQPSDLEPQGVRVDGPLTQCTHRGGQGGAVDVTRLQAQQAGGRGVDVRHDVPGDGDHDGLVERSDHRPKPVGRLARPHLDVEQWRERREPLHGLGLHGAGDVGRRWVRPPEQDDPQLVVPDGSHEGASRLEGQGPQHPGRHQLGEPVRVEHQLRPEVRVAQ